MNTLNKNSSIVITGAAGLLGQNLITSLIERGYTNIKAIDKNSGSLAILRRIHPRVSCICADLSAPTAGTSCQWSESFADCAVLFLLQAQITGVDYVPFEQNTIKSTQNILRAAKEYSVPFIVFTGSSVVNSVAKEDNYIKSKKAQEALVISSGVDYCVVRPTLMFGWFDPKHLGYLSRFMEHTPVFPIPGNGKFMRQPLYARDVCRVLIWCAEHKPCNQIFDIAGEQKIDYIDIIRLIKKVKKSHTVLLRIPVVFFRFLLKVYAFLFNNPPFVADQLDALTANDDFKGVNLKQTFGITATPFEAAIHETFCHPEYGKIVLKR